MRIYRRWIAQEVYDQKRFQLEADKQRNTQQLVEYSSDDFRIPEEFR